jgi:histidine triad (HIT) family protein
MTKSDRCIFCRIVDGSAQAAIVYDDERTLAFVDLRQANPGHVLVIPKMHINDVRELDSDTGSALMQSVARVTSAVGRAFPNNGISLWHSIGEAAFQEVPHLHIHIHPRLDGDRLLQVYPGEPVDVDFGTRARYAAMLRHELPGLQAC